MFNLPDLKPDEVIIYLRKSRTDDPALTVSETLAKHEQMLDDYCRRTWNELIPEQNRFREIVSGETIEARPEIQKVLRLIEQDRYKAILIVEPQRLSRGDLEDIGRLSKLLRYTHTYVITLQYSYDLADERDRDYFERELKRGNEYLEYSKRIMANGRALAAENGNFFGNRTPYGYKRLKVKEGRKYITTLEIIPEEAEIVREIYQMYIDGHGLAAICKHLNLFCKPKVSKSWSRASVHNILVNPVYIGLIKWQQSKTIKVVENGEVVKRRQKCKEYQTFPGKHDPIISEEIWNAAKERREAASAPRTKVSYALKNPFAGLIFCECGTVLTYYRNKRNSERLYCKNLTCNSASCTFRAMKEIVADILLQSISDFEVKISAGEDDRSAEKATFRDQLKKRLAALDDKETSIWEKYAEGMPKRVFDTLISELTEERSRIETMLSQAEEEKLVCYSELVTTFHAALDCLESDESAEKKNALLKKCIRKITYHRMRSESKRDMNPISVDVELNL